MCEAPQDFVYTVHSMGIVQVAASKAYTASDTFVLKEVSAAMAEYSRANWPLHTQSVGEGRFLVYSDIDEMRNIGKADNKVFTSYLSDNEKRATRCSDSDITSEA